MKGYERMAEHHLMPGLPVLARLDGRCFSRFTRDLEAPFDRRLHALMVDVTHWLVDEAAARGGYTQFDEITLWWDHDQTRFVEGRIQKMATLLASYATATFLHLLPLHLPRKSGLRPLPTFDGRVWAVPNREEALNAILWREFDCTRNSIQSAARAHCSHKECLHKNGSELQDMLHAKGINWNDYPAAFRRGTYVVRRKVLRTLTPEELAKMPERQRPTGPVERTTITTLDVPPLMQVVNRMAVLFEGAEPLRVPQLPGVQEATWHGPPEAGSVRIRFGAKVPGHIVLSPEAVEAMQCAFVHESSVRCAYPAGHPGDHWCVLNVPPPGAPVGA
jgi:tRNA(His) 5'-end guanylyltransferase